MEDNEEVWLSNQAHNDRLKAGWLKFWMMDYETSQKPYQLPTASIKAALSLRRSSVWYSRPCRLSQSRSLGFLVWCGRTRTKAFQDPSIIVRIEYLRHLKTVTKASGPSCLLKTVPSSANAEQMMQNELDCSSQGCDNFGRTISTTKTEVMYQLAPGKLY